jgi:beta-carotene 15,15'-dioxygenase
VADFEKLRKYLLGFGLLIAISAHLLPIQEEFQLYFLIFIITLTGIPHGSLDYFIERQSFINSNQTISIQKFLFKYLFSMVCYGIAWWLFPTFSLIAFIVMAAYHFGEIDWPLRSDTKLDAALYTLYGFLLIVFILTSHISSAAPILETIVQNKVSTAFWLKWGTVLFPYSCLLLGLNILVLFYIHSRLGWEKKVLFQFFAQSILLIVIIYWLPLYLSFGFYFGLWHSFISFNLIRKQMKLANDYAGWIYLVKKAIPFTAIALLGIFFLMFVSQVSDTEWWVLSNLFIGIAILTLPHLQVFTKIKFA